MKARADESNSHVSHRHAAAPSVLAALPRFERAGPCARPQRPEVRLDDVTHLRRKRLLQVLGRELLAVDHHPRHADQHRRCSCPKALPAPLRLRLCRLLRRLEGGELEFARHESSSPNASALPSLPPTATSFSRFARFSALQWRRGHVIVVRHPALDAVCVGKPRERVFHQRDARGLVPVSNRSKTTLMSGWDFIASLNDLSRFSSTAKANWGPP